MGIKDLNSLLSFSFLVAPPILGLVWGRTLRYPGEPPNSLTTAAFVACSFFVADLLVVPKKHPHRRLRYALDALLLGAALLVLLVDPLYLISAEAGVLGGAILIAAFSLAAAECIRRRAICSAIGAAIFATTCTALLAAMVGWSYTGAGFFGSWKR